MGHVDALEIHRANKFQWTARQYYYGLLQTLRAVALLTANSLEEELIEIDLLAYMPGWFQAEMNELRSVISGETTYPQLEPRTKLSILFSFFEDKQVPTRLGRSGNDEFPLCLPVRPGEYRGMGNADNETAEAGGKTWSDDSVQDVSE